MPSWALRQAILRNRGTFVRSSGSERPPLPSTLGADVGLIDLSLSYPIYCEDPDLAGALSLLVARMDVSRLLCYQSAHAWVKKGVRMIFCAILLLTRNAS